MNRVRLRIITAVAVLITICVDRAGAQFDCNNAPGEPWRTICRSLVSWDVSARQIQQQRAAVNQNRVVAAPAVPDQPWLSPAVPQQEIATQAQGCMNLDCLCAFMQGLRGPSQQCQLRQGGTLQKAVRREIRTLSHAERQRLFQVMQQMKNSGHYDSMSSEHRAVGTSSGAHSGPGFLPWHREFMKRFEISLRLIDPNLALPYWDSVLDSHLPRPTDSIFFSPIFIGESDAFGQVINGPFAGWRTLEGKPYIGRALGREGRLFTETDLNNVYGQTRLEQVMAYTVPEQSCPYQPNFAALEYTHASVHIFIGGDMKPPVTSANDPVFFLHHCFVDLIFEQWRQTRQDRFQRETMYPPDIAQCSNQQHFSNAIMRPYTITNRQGLSNSYTDFLYQFAERPNCNNNCGNSEFLFCDHRNTPHCVSKVKMNGLCQGFEDLDVCYQGVCRNGVCVPGAFQSTQQDSASVSTTTATPVAVVTPPQRRVQATVVRNTAQQLQQHPGIPLKSNVQTSMPERSNTPASWGRRSRPLPTRRLQSPASNKAHFPSSQRARANLQNLKQAREQLQPARQQQQLSFQQPPQQQQWQFRQQPQQPQQQQQILWFQQPQHVQQPTQNIFQQPFWGRRRRAHRRRPLDHHRMRRWIQATMLEENLKHPIKPAANLTLAEAACFNDDPCCRGWAQRNECDVNPAYMNAYCKRSCDICKPTLDALDEGQSKVELKAGCVNRHISCAFWKQSGECTRSRQWMAENCRKACGWCDVTDKTLCRHVAMMSRM